MSISTLDIPPEVVAALELPSLDTLADARVRGAECLWCDEILTAQTAVDLGEQMSPLSGVTSPMRWFPRSCRPCAAGQAHTALFKHGSTCALCKVKEKAGDCTIGRGLYRIIRDGRR